MKKLFKYCSFVILTILFFSLYNNIEAKDIKIHGTSWDKGVAFQTEVGAATEEYQNFGTFGTIKYYQKDQAYVKPYGDNIYQNFPGGRVRSYSFLIHNKPFTIYKDGKSKDSVYGYVSEYNNYTTKYTNIIGANNNVNYIEFAKLSNGYTIVHRKINNADYYPNITYNYFPKSYIDILKNDLNKYVAGTDISNGKESYYFYISEPLAWKYKDEAYGEIIEGAQRDVYEESGRKIKRNVGVLTAKDVDNLDPRNYQYIQNKIANYFGISRKKFLWRWCR